MTEIWWWSSDTNAVGVNGHARSLFGVKAGQSQRGDERIGAKALRAEHRLSPVKSFGVRLRRR